MATKKKEEVKVHNVVLVSADELHEHPKNKNKQSRHEFKETKESIKDNGFDENLLIVPRTKEEGEGYWVVSGNHRLRAGKSLKMKEFPCVLHTEWDGTEQQIQLLRRNMIRGEITKEGFTMAVNVLEEDSQLELAVIQDRLGFEDPDKFAHYYQEQREREETVATSTASSGAAPKVKMVEDLGLIVSALLEQYGDTVPNSFIIFPTGNKNHLFVQSSPTLKRLMETIRERCVRDGMDINVALSGLISIGMSQTDFKKPTASTDTIVEEGTSDEGDADL